MFILQYQEDVNELNEVARQRPHAALAAGIQQENRHLRKLQQENRELRAALEEYQNALELIMSKYRQQTDTLIRQNQMDLTRVYQTSDIDVSGLLKPLLKTLNFSLLNYE